MGVPKTIDDDLKGGGIGVSFGFDSASGVYAETIGNLCSDARSAGKYWHFVRVMGRNASHLTLECALRCAPNVALIGEEVAAEKITLAAVVDDECCAAVVAGKTIASTGGNWLCWRRNPQRRRMRFAK